VCGTSAATCAPASEGFAFLKSAPSRSWSKRRSFDSATLERAWTRASIACSESMLFGSEGGRGLEFTDVLVRVMQDFRGMGEAKVGKRLA
jgi:hypothetical protein